MRKKMEGYEGNEEIADFTISDEEIENLREKYGNEITLVIQMGKKDSVPLVSVKVAGKDNRHLASGEKLGKIIMDWIMQTFKNYSDGKS